MVIRTLPNPSKTDGHPWTRFYTRRVFYSNTTPSSSSMAQQPTSGPGRLIVKLSMSHTFRRTHTHTHTRQDCSKWVISWSQRRLPTQRTTTTSDEHRWPQRDSNPQSQQSIAGIAFTQLHRDRPTTTPTLFIYCSFLCNNSSYLTYTNITSFTLNTISSGIKITKNKAKYLAHSRKLRIDEVTENALTLHMRNNLIIKWL